MTLQDVVNIEGQLGYTYPKPDKPVTVFQKPVSATETKSTSLTGINRPQHHAIVSGINRAQLSGSFIIAMHKVNTATKERTVVGYQAVLNRWQTAGCANCQTHLNVRAHIPLRALTAKDVENKDIVLEGSVIGRRATAKDDQIIDDYGTEEDAWRWEVMDTLNGEVVDKNKLTASPA
jgi:tyrosinase